MNRTTTLVVGSFSPPQREAIESVVGGRLAEDARLYIAVCGPDAAEPAESTRATARARLEQIFAEVDRHVAASGATEAEFDASIDEALDRVRSRRRD